MSSATFPIVQGDTNPPLVLKLYHPDTGLALELAVGDTVKFRMADRTTNVLAFAEANATILEARAPGTNSATDPGILRLKYQWAAGNTNVAGSYAGVFVVTSTGGGRRTYPTDRQVQVEVVPIPGGLA